MVAHRRFPAKGEKGRSRKIPGSFDKKSIRARRKYFPQGLKAAIIWVFYGAAEAAPFQSFRSVRAAGNRALSKRR
jgi:hypothetical protein